MDGKFYVRCQCRYGEFPSLQGTNITNSTQTIGTISHFILAMTLNGHVLKKAQEEIARVVGDQRLPDFGDRADLPYGTAHIAITFIIS